MAPVARLVIGHVDLSLDPKCYRLTAIQKAAYRLAERCTAVIGSPTETTIPVMLQFKPTTTEDSAKETVRLFYQELLDQELREKIGEETAPIRALILAHAFSNTDLIKRE